MNYECAYAPKLEGWVVEAVGSDGEVFVTQFYGPDAEERAREYRAWKSEATSRHPQPAHAADHLPWRNPRKFLTAWTAEKYTGLYPPYVNATQVGSMVEITIRAPGRKDGSEGPTLSFRVNVWTASKIGETLVKATQAFECGLEDRVFEEHHLSQPPTESAAAQAPAQPDSAPEAPELTRDEILARRLSASDRYAEANPSDATYNDDFFDMLLCDMALRSLDQQQALARAQEVSCMDGSGCHRASLTERAELAEANLATTRDGLFKIQHEAEFLYRDAPSEMDAIISLCIRTLDSAPSAKEGQPGEQSEEGKQ